MSWRDRIAQAVTEAFARRTDLPTKVYHGSNVGFSEFKDQPVGYMLDRGLGTHVGKDPALASAFADRWIKDKGPDYFSRWTKEVKGDPQVYPLRIPAEDKFLQVQQPSHGSTIPNLQPWQGIKHDEYAVEGMMADAAYRKDPDMLTRYLIEARRMPPDEAAAAAKQLASGGTAMLEGQPHDMARFISNYGGKPYNDADRALMTQLARQHWQDQGYAGLRYVNTSPTEAGAAGVKDPTSYIVFDPANIRSEFAQMDPAKISSRDLLAGIVGYGTPTGIGALAAQDHYAPPEQTELQQ